MLFIPRLQDSQIQKPSNYQQQQPHLPFGMHRLPQGSSKRVKIVNFDQVEITCTFTPKITIM